MTGRSRYFIYLISFFISWLPVANAQNIATGEYFWNTDPGVGNGTALFAKDGTFDELLETVIKTGISLPTSGVNKFNVRTKDTSSNWGPLFSVIVYVQDSLASSTRQIKITQAEYFWDTDPGQGLGTALVALDGTLDEAVEIVMKNNMSLPSSGIHKFSVRVKSADGAWGPVFSSVINVEDSLSSAVRNIKVMQAEYFWDTDPGIGLGNTLLAIDGNLDEAFESVFNDTLNLPASGLHTFNTRVKDANNTWGPVFSVVVNVENVLSTDLRNIKVLQAEYFWDSDPGIGNGKTLLALDGNLDEALESVLNDTVNLPTTGIYKFSTRVKDAEGVWGPVFSVVVNVDDSLTSSTRSIYVAQGEGFWNTDPGLGSGTAFLSFDGTFDEAMESISANVITDNVAIGLNVFYVRVKDPNGNWGPVFGSVIEIEPCPTTASAGNDTTICLGDNTIIGGAPTASAGNDPYSYTWTPSTGLSSDTIANPTASPTITTSYIITVVDSFGCNDKDTIIVTVSNLIVDGGTNISICLGDSAILGGSPVVTGGTGSYNYSWSPTAGLDNSALANPKASPSGTTQYLVTVTDAVTGCSNNDSVNVTIGATVATASGDTGICQGESAQLNANGGVTYTWSPGSSLNDSTVSNPVASPTVSTSYIVTVSSGSCFDTDTVNITVYDNPIATITPNDSTSFCSGGSVNLSSDSTAGNQWYKNNTGLGGEVGQNYTANTSGDYYLVITNPNNCIDTSAITAITVYSLPIAEAGNDATICIGDSLQLTATGGVSYSWIPGTDISNSAVADPFVYPKTNTTYYVTVTDSNNCQDTDSINITVNSTTADAGTDNSVCDGGSVQLNATGGVTYSWSSGSSLSDSTIANPLASPSVSTTYIVTVSSGSCFDTDTVSITVYDNPVAVITPADSTEFCIGGSVILGSDSTTGNQWYKDNSILGGETSQNYTTNTSGDYYLVITNTNNCVDTSTTVTVTVYSLPIAEAGTDETLCVGDSVQITATGGVNYSWTPGTDISDAAIADPFVYPTTNTTYYVVVTDSNNCQDTDSINITVNSTTADAGADTNICDGGSVQLNASGGVIYNWAVSSDLDNLNIANPIASPASTATYYVMISDAAGCSVLDSVVVTINASPTVVTSNDTSLCSAGTVQLMASGGSNYSWSPTTGLSDPNISNPVATLSSSTTYYVTVTNSNGCESIDSVVIAISTLTGASAGSDVDLCIGDSVQLNASGGVNYSWTPSTGLSNVSIANPIANPTATTTYSVTITDSSGCGGIDDLIITVNALPSAITGNDTSICVGENTQLSASGGNTYSWSPITDLNNPNISNPIASPTSTVTYSVSVVDTNGCEDIGTVKIIVNPSPTISAGNDVSLCEGDSVELTASGGNTYSWNPSAGLSCSDCKAPMAGPASTTNYTVTGVNANGCSNTDDVIVTVNTVPIVTFAGLDTAYCESDAAVILTGSPTGGTFSGPGIIENKFDPSIAGKGTHVVVYTFVNSDGCSGTDKQSVVVKTCTGINDKLNKHYIKVFPNPFKDRTQIVYQLNEPANVRITVLSILSQEISILVDANQGNGYYNVNLNVNEIGLSSGIYLLKIEIDEAFKVIRLEAVPN
ncbi:MAG: hypothetical protein COC01_06595 [Bacteroidetes bacterium]|nr:MAG: hypothetical protein COC01_06595 [Bacteroidota bacterium]